MTRALRGKLSADQQTPIMIIHTSARALTLRTALLTGTAWVAGCGANGNDPAGGDGFVVRADDSRPDDQASPTSVRDTPTGERPSPPGGESPAELFPADAVGALQPSQPASGAASPTEMPADFTAADRGGWKLGAALAVDAGDGAELAQETRPDGCGSVLTGILRDIPESHPDFGGDVTNLQRGLVLETLGADGKPALSADFDDGFIESADSFRQWYETLPGVNLAYSLALYFEPNSGKFSFESHDFFPLDGEGFGNEGQDHNFSFTYELHTRFRYLGGERFEFSGDDDLWVFVNGRLAIDLGGVHAANTQDISLDDEASRLGISIGNEYALDFFQAERHATQSNFQVDTTLEFTNCGVAAPR